MVGSSALRFTVVLLLWIGICAAPLGLVGAEEEASWPAKGPRRTGRTLEFPTHNVRWTMPEGSPLAWVKPAEDESTRHGSLVMARARVGNHQARAEFRVEPTPQPVILNADPPSEATRVCCSHLLDSMDEDETIIEHGIPLGNAVAMRTLKVGTWKGVEGYACQYARYLRGEMLLFEYVVVLPEGQDDELGPALAALLEGIEFTARPWVCGPCEIPGTVFTDRPRGRGQGEEVEVVTEGLKAKKPAEMSGIRWNVAEAGAFQRLAWECWSEDRGKYLYFDAHTISTSGNSKTERVDEEDRVKWRSDYFKTDVFKDWKLVHKGKKLWFKTRFGRRRGIGYRFSGTFQGHPFVELGYLLEHKRRQYWFRVQLGGQGAEEHFEDLVAEIIRNVKL